MPGALNLFGLALAVGAPALIARFSPRRWRAPLVILWALAPPLILLAIPASEAMGGKAGTAEFGKLVDGLLLIGSFLLLPWLMSVGTGFAIGTVLRGRLTRKAIEAGPAPSTPPQRHAQPPAVYIPLVDADSPSLSPPSGWRAAHVGLDHDDLLMDGLAVWSLPWREEAGQRVMLAHPAYAEQQHEFRIYSIDDGARATRFAAAELSNGVWGFYRWVVAADIAWGDSADGSLRYEHDLGPCVGGRYDRVAPLARLYDKSSVALLFDGGAWQSSRIVPQADGSLLLSLEQGELQTIFRIDPPAGAFRDLTTSAGSQPLADLARTAAAARANCDDPINTYLGRRVAPDGSLKVDLQSVEWRSGLWVRSPLVTEIATGRVLLDLWGTDWDAGVSFPRGATLRLSLRRCHFGGGGDVELEVATERYVLYQGSSATFGPLRDLPEALKGAWGAGRSPVPAPLRLTARNWLVALSILVAALVLIAAATLITRRLQVEPAPRRLDTIPPMPGHFSARHE